MSEYINNSSERLGQLVQYALRMHDGERGSTLYAEFEEVIQKITPKDVVTIVDELVKTSEDIDDVKRTVNKILNTFYKSIKKFGKANPKEGSFLFFLIEENAAMQIKMAELKTEVKAVFSHKDSAARLIEHKESLRSKLLELKDYEKHYLKKENILFPYFEKVFPDHRCVNVMWSMHDDARKNLNKLIVNLERDKPSINEFNFDIGRYYFSVLPVIFRDDYILYSICQQSFNNQMQLEMIKQSLDIGFCFIDTPILEQFQNKLKEDEKSLENENNKIAEGLVNLETGQMSVDQIINVYNHLPVDITFVDENNEVAYFSNPKDRFFTRSKAIIGRKVHNCHPPESVHIVRKIIHSFKDGENDKESFWIQMNGKFILIQYFAVRNGSGKYLGTIEVSQDITNIRKLEGEKRLLD